MVWLIHSFGMVDGCHVVWHFSNINVCYIVEIDEIDEFGRMYSQNSEFAIQQGFDAEVRKEKKNKKIKFSADRMMRTRRRVVGKC